MDSREGISTNLREFTFTKVAIHCTAAGQELFCLIFFKNGLFVIKKEYTFAAASNERQFKYVFGLIFGNGWMAEKTILVW